MIEVLGAGGEKKNINRQVYDVFLGIMVHKRRNIQMK